MNWLILESIPGLLAVPSAWRKWLADDFDAFSILCLQPHAYIAQSFPCPVECGCWHKVVHNEDGSIRALCRCKPPKCPDLTLTMADITTLQVNRAKLCRAICKAFDCHPKITAMAPANTYQISSWSADAVPVILTIQTERHQLRFVITELHARLHRPFILLTPTTNLVDAACQELLTHAKAAIFGLDTTVRLTDHGTLQCLKSPGQLFAQFTPQPKDSADEDAARQTIALVKAFQDKSTTRKAPLLKVFRFYCVDAFSAAEVARKCDCTPALIFIRLRTLRALLGRDPAELRQYATHFQAIEQSLSDPRARTIHRKAAIYGQEDDQAE